ncbi:MAG TPA: hypothetical protein VF720_01935 [Candidatus Eisenbacteria bacterium]
MIRIVMTVLALSLAAASPATAGRIFGDIKMDGKPAPAGLQVVITQPLAGKDSTAAGADTTVTDKFGSYKLNVKTEGKCLLSVKLAKETATLAVFSYKVATRYDLILEKIEGKLSLRRK